MTEETIQQEEEKLTPEEARKRRIQDAQLQKTLDASWGIFQEPIKEMLVELNVRLLQYKQQFHTFSFEFLVLQCVQDFKRYIIPLQAKDFDDKKPVAIDRGNQMAIVIKDQLFEYKE